MRRLLSITALLACFSLLTACMPKDEREAPKGSCRIRFKNLDLDFEAVHARLTDYNKNKVYAEIRVEAGKEAYLGYIESDNDKFSYIVELFRSNWITDSKVDPCGAKKGKAVTVNWAGTNIWNCE
jgi:hypothetical protein